MPQLQLYASQTPTRLVLTYESDPLDPLGPVTLSAIVEGAKHNRLWRASAKVNGPHLDEWVGDLMQSAWLTYLYGDPSEIQRTWTPISRHWRTFSTSPLVPR